MLSEVPMYLHLISGEFCRCFPGIWCIAFVFFDFRRCFPDRGTYKFASPLAFLLFCRYFPGIWCILSCFYFELQMLSGYLVYPILLFFCFADAFPVFGVSYLAFILSCRCFLGICCICICLLGDSADAFQAGAYMNLLLIFHS